MVFDRDLSLNGMDRNLALEFVRVTESAAIAAARWVGKKDAKAADQAAVDEMRSRFNQVDFKAEVIIGEGSKDEAPELYVGEIVGNGQGPEMDLAVDPLEATDSVAHGRDNAQSVIVTGSKGSLFHAPDTYMDKIAVGPKAKAVISFDNSVAENLKKIAQALGKKESDLTIIVMDRDRNKELIDQINKVGAKVKLITDGDMAGAIATCAPDSGVDAMMGIGGSTEAVLAAAAVKAFGGEIICKFTPHIRNDEAEILKYLAKSGNSDIKKVYTAEDLASGDDLTFTATGILAGPLLDGVVFKENEIITHSIVIRLKSGTIRYIKAHHRNN